MDLTSLRRDIARLLTEARGKSEQLAQATCDGVLQYFIEMAIIEVLALQADAMDESTFDGGNLHGAAENVVH